MWEQVKAFFEGQSALANFAQIGGAVVALSLAAWRAFVWARKSLTERRITSVASWLRGRTVRPANARDLKVVVVDDRPDDYPLDTLRRLGYTVTHIGRLSLADVPSLRAYDCVLLDINGVLAEDLKRGGLEVLRRLKDGDGPYVVAVSSRGFDITLSEFFMLADHRLKKPIPHVELEGIIDQAFVLRYSALHAAERIDAALSLAATPRTRKRALLAVRRCLESNGESDAVRTSLGLLMTGSKLETTLRDVEIVRQNLCRAP